MTYYSRRQLEALGEPLGESVTRKEGGRIIYGGGGSGGGGAPTQTTTYSTNIPEYARPYVENMLQSTQAQIYNADMTGFRPYQPYSTNVENYFAGFSPLQQQAQQSAYYMTPPSQFDLGTGLAGAAGVGGLSAAEQAGVLGGQALGYGAAGSQYGDLGAQQALMRAQQTARQAGQFGRLGAGFGAQAAGLAPTAQAYGATAADVGMGGLGYGAMGAGYGAQAAGLSPTAQIFGQEAADIGAAGGAGAQALAQQVARQATGYGGQLARSGRLGLQAGEEMGAIGSQGLGYGALGTGYGARGAQAAEQGFGAGEAFARQATDPYATAAYMSPYMQNVVDYQKSQALRDYAIGQGLRRAQAVGAGAFGGSRQAIAESEAERALQSQLQGIAATGSQKAFEDAQRQQQFGAQLGLQGLGAGYQGLGVGMQGVGQGLAGLGTALQGQQGRLAGLSAYQQGLQGAQAGLGQALGAGQLGLSGTQQALAGQQARLGALSQAGQFLGQGMQGAQVGMAGISPALQGLQGAQAGLGQAGQLYGLGMQGAGLGLQGVGAQQAAGQLGLAGTAQGIQGAQAGMQGVQGAIGAGQYGLGGLGAATQAAGTLGQLGGAQFGAEKDIINLQSTLGAQQQQLEQAKINQAIQDYAIAQQYPFMQLGLMNAMLRGLPLQTQTTQLYQAQPSTLQQGVGLLGAGASLFGRKEGGVIKMAKGGIADAYKYGGAIPEPKLESMADRLSIDQLQERLRDPALTPGERQIFAEALQEKIRARESGIAAAGGPAFESMSMAGGGIVAFGDPELNPDEDQVVKDEDKVLSFDEKLRRAAAAPKTPFQYDSLASKIGQFPSKLAQLQPTKKYTPEQLDEIARGQGVFPEGSPALPGMPPVEEVKPAEKKEAKQTGTKGTAAAQAAEDKAAGQGANSFAKFLAEIKGAGPKGQIGAEYEKFLDERLGKSAERLSRDERMAMAKGFLKFASTPAPGGIGQAAAAGLTEYATGVETARKAQDTMENEAQKARMDLDKARRAEERGDVAAAREAYDKYEDRMNRIKTAQINAGAAGQAGRFEKEAVERVMAENPGMKFADALQVVRGAGRFESTEVQKAKVALEDINQALLTMSKKDPRRAELEAQRQRILQMLTPGGGIGGGQVGGGQSPGILRFDAQGNLIKG